MSIDPGSFTPPAPAVPGASPWSTALWAAPDLWNSPTLAMTAATSTDPGGVAQGLAHLNRVAAVHRAVQQDEEHHGLFGGVWHHIVGAAKTGLNVLAKPLEEVQHEYRYIHDVYVHHGFWAGMAETLSAAAVFTAATVASGGNVAAGALAAEGAVAAEAALFYHDSWKRSEDAKVSPGRDLAHLFGIDNTDHGLGKVVSGVGDAAFDLTADPLIKIGAIARLRRGMHGFSGTTGSVVARMAGRSEAVQAAMNRFAPGMRIGSPEQVDNAWKAYPAYRRATDRLAELDNAGAIVREFPEYAGVADQLAEASTGPAVHQVFREGAFDAEWLKRIGTGALPSRSVMRVKATRVVDKLRADSEKNQELPIFAGVRRYTDTSGDAQAVFQRGIAFSPELWLNSEKWKSVAARKLRTFSTYNPYTLDKNTFMPTGRFSYMHDDSTTLQGLLRSMSYAMGERTAQRKLAEYVSLKSASGVPDLQARKAWWAETQAEILKAAGFPDDPEAYAHLVQKGRHITAGPMHNEAYGFGRRTGDDVNQIRTDEGTWRGAIWGWQTDTESAFPDFKVLNDTMRQIHSYSKWYGKIDHVTAEHYTNTWFKPLALATGGFGLRVALAEAIPGIMRHGMLNFIGTRVEQSAKSIGYKLTTDEEKHAIYKALDKALGGKLVRMVHDDPDTVDLVTRNLIDWQGHHTTGVASAGHNSWASPDDLADAVHYGVDQSVKRNGRLFWKGSGEFFTFAPDDREFIKHWHYGIERRAADKGAQTIAQDIKAGHSFEELIRRESQRISGVDPNTGLSFGTKAVNRRALADPYTYDRERLSRLTAQDSMAAAHARVDDLENYIYGRDGKRHDFLLNHIASGHSDVDINLLKKVDPASRPRGVAGEVPEPFLGPNVVQRVITSSFAKVVNPIIQHLSRDPLFNVELKTQWKALADARAAGIMDDELALSIARKRAMLALVPQIHNTHMRTQFHYLVRNILPFYFAQEQALKRVGHLINKNPAAFREYQQLAHLLNDPHFIQVDDQGNRFLLMPKIGEVGVLSQLAMSSLGMPVQYGLPFTVTGDTQSLKTVFPEAATPSTSPFMAIALNHIADLDPAFAPVVKKITGERGSSEGFLQALIPNTPLRSAVQGLMADEGDTAYANAMMAALQSAYYHGKMPPADDPVAQQEFMDRIKNNARSVFFVKAIVASISPLTPRVAQTDFGLRDEFYKLKDKYGSFDRALQVFLKEHGDRAISYTVAQTKSATGAYAPATTAALNYITANQGLIHDHPWAASFMLPQEEGKGDAQLVYSELLKSHLRERETPTEFMRAIYSSTGVSEWIAANDDHQRALAALEGNTAGQEMERRNFDVWQNQTWRVTNPIAYDYWFGPERGTNAATAYTDIVSTFNEGRQPNNQQAEMTYALVQDFERHRAALAALGTDRANGSNRSAERDAWKNYLNALAQKSPLMSSVIHAVFLPMTNLQEGI